MHELGIIQNIFPMIEQVAKENNLKSINKVILGIGDLRQVKKEFLQFAFEAVAKDTVAVGAELVINAIPIVVVCHDCKKKFFVKENAYVCPECGGVSVEVLTGKEVVLESIDGEV